MSNCYANDEKPGHFINISSKVPKSMMISEIPSWDLEHPHVLSDPNDPNQVIRNREIDYTIFWLRKTINQEILNNKVNLEVLKNDFQLLSGLGKNKDDALMVRFNIEPFDIIVVDGRFIALSIRAKNEVQADVEEVLKKIVRYWSGADKYRVKVNMETLSATDSNDSWGQIIVYRNSVGDLYIKPVEWYKAGNEVIFAFDKVVKPPDESKVSLIDKAPLYFGGIPINDDRSYLRFKKSNREELAKEYFQKRKKEDNEVHKINSNGFGGLPYGGLPNPSEPNK
jgi:hypothetical protein